MGWLFNRKSKPKQRPRLPATVYGNNQRYVVTIDGKDYVARSTLAMQKMVREAKNDSREVRWRPFP